MGERGGSERNKEKIKSALKRRIVAKTNKQKHHHQQQKQALQKVFANSKHMNAEWPNRYRCD